MSGTIIYPDNISLKIEEITPEKRKSLKRGFSKYVHERAQKQGYKIYTLFNGRFASKITGYLSLSKLEMSERYFAKYLLPFNEFCQAYCKEKGLDELKYVIFVDSEQGVIVLLHHGIVARYLNEESLKDTRHLIDTVKEIQGGLPDVSSEEMRVLYDHHIEALSGDIWEFEDKIIKEADKEQFIKNPFYSFVRKLILKKSASVEEADRKRREKEKDTGAIESALVWIGISVALNIFFTVLLGLFAYKAFSHTPNTEDVAILEKQIDLVGTRIAKVESKVTDIEKALEAFRKEAQATREIQQSGLGIASQIEMLTSEVRTLRDQVNRSTALAHIPSLPPARTAPSAPVPAKPEKTSTAATQAVSSNAAQKVLSEVDCVPRLISNRFVVCESGGSMFKVPKGRFTKVKVDGREVEFGYFGKKVVIQYDGAKKKIDL